jgi:hypothetical protein
MWIGKIMCGLGTKKNSCLSAAVQICLGRHQSLVFRQEKVQILRFPDTGSFLVFVRIMKGSGFVNFFFKGIGSQKTGQYFESFQFSVQVFKGSVRLVFLRTLSDFIGFQRTNSFGFSSDLIGFYRFSKD